MPFIQWVKVTRNIRQGSTGFDKPDFHKVNSIYQKFEGQILIGRFRINHIMIHIAINSNSKEGGQNGIQQYTL